MDPLPVGDLHGILGQQISQVLGRRGGEHGRLQVHQVGDDATVVEMAVRDDDRFRAWIAHRVLGRIARLDPVVEQYFIVDEKGRPADFRPAPMNFICMVNTSVF